MGNDNQAILEIKQLVDGLPLSRRIPLYRWMATVTKDAWLGKSLIGLANELETVDQLSRSLDFNIENGKTGGAK